jgi:hypothetical protein
MRTVSLAPLDSRADLVGGRSSPVTGEIAPDEVKIALGEIGDIWPARI